MSIGADDFGDEIDHSPDARHLGDAWVEDIRAPIGPTNLNFETDSKIERTVNSGLP
ncbi:MAG: hypothetical protein ACYC0C_12420 [Devosia sp.]